MTPTEAIKTLAGQHRRMRHSGVAALSSDDTEDAVVALFVLAGASGVPRRIVIDEMQYVEPETQE